MVETREVHGHKVVFEENAHGGVRYLRDELSREEAQVFFDEAKLRGSAEFESKMGHNYDLLHHADEYTLVRR